MRALTLKEGNEDVNLQRRYKKEKMLRMLMKVTWHPLMTFLFHQSDSAFLFCSASETSDRDCDDSDDLE